MDKQEIIDYNLMSQAIQPEEVKREKANLKVGDVIRIVRGRGLTTEAKCFYKVIDKYRYIFKAKNVYTSEVEYIDYVELALQKRSDRKEALRLQETI